MQRLKMMFLAVMAVCALSAVVSATASARENPAFLPEVAQAFTGESGAGTLSTLAGKKVECKKDKSEGTIAANGREGKLHILFRRMFK